MSERMRAPLLSLFSLAFSIVAAPGDAREAVHEAAAETAPETATAACVAPLPSAASIVTLHLADRVGLPKTARDEMMRETINLWRAAGVTVTWEAPAIDRSHPQVTVIVTPDIPAELLSGATHARVMASILFVDDKPTSLIGAYPGQVQRLLETIRTEVRPIDQRPAALRHQLMGRVLGRAIAHELGHFLSGSAEHTSDGLMRATHRLDELTSPFSQAFRVAPARSPIAATLAQASQCW